MQIDGTLNKLSTVSTMHMKFSSCYEIINKKGRWKDMLEVMCNDVERAIFGKQSSILFFTLLVLINLFLTAA